MAPPQARDRYYQPQPVPPVDRLGASTVIPARSAPTIAVPPPQQPKDGTSLVERAQAIFGGLGTRYELEEVQAAIADLESVAPASPVTPAYVADVDDMVTCGRADLVRWVAASHNHSSGSYAANSTTGKVAGSSGSTVVSLSPAPATYKPSTPTSLTSSLAPVDYTPIVVDRRGVVKKLRWRVGNDANVFSIDAYYMALCVYNPATLSIEKVWDSGNIKDGVANTTSLREVGVDLGIDQICTPGQILFVAHQQIAPGLAQEARTYACRPQTGDVARPGQLLDAWYYRTPNNVGSIPSTVTLASLNRRNDCIPWAGVTVDTSALGEVA
ncbi:minor tail protein [Gordonia phage PCoral7]|uniref:Minor tail protein n=1 Tax=Gordonia phage Toast TaxID=2599852 RepID=A0A5J6TBA4_9CAUD|nr:minor tail protein [Gordonia phage Toast]QFG08090.1 minor tail protein [Gordonia phage Toast]UVF60537.1 minor tail protein [Gordonia phage PCoral7]